MPRKISGNDLKSIFSLVTQKQTLQKYAYILDSQIPQIQKVWPTVAGTELAVHSLPYKIEKKVLYVRTEHPIYAQELQFNMRLIVEAINQQLFIQLSGLQTHVGRIYWPHKQAQETSSQNIYTSKPVNENTKMKDALSKQHSLVQQQENKLCQEVIQKTFKESLWSELIQTVRNFQE